MPALLTNSKNEASGTTGRLNAIRTPTFGGTLLLGPRSPPVCVMPNGGVLTVAEKSPTTPSRRLARHVPPSGSGPRGVKTPLRVLNQVKSPGRSGWNAIGDCAAGPSSSPCTIGAAKRNSRVEDGCISPDSGIMVTLGSAARTGTKKIAARAATSDGRQIFFMENAPILRPRAWQASRLR